MLQFNILHVRTIIGWLAYSFRLTREKTHKKVCATTQLEYQNPPDCCVICKLHVILHDISLEKHQPNKILPILGAWNMFKIRF